MLSVLSKKIAKGLCLSITAFLCFVSPVFAQNPTWSDEFNGSSVDSTKWNFEANGWGGGNNELQYYTARPENVQVKDGNLYLIAKPENYLGKTYTSGRINSMALQSFKYGKVEVRAKVLKGKGLWPAIWFLPTDRLYGDWPRSGEIDLVEVLGNDATKLYNTLHFGNPDHQSYGTNYVLPSGNYSDDYHTYLLDWRPDSILMYMDGLKTFATDFTKPFDQRFHIIFNLAVGGNWPGSPDANTPFPDTLKVDYVRVWSDTTTRYRNPDGPAGTVPGLAYDLWNTNNPVFLTIPSSLGTGTTANGKVTTLALPAGANLNRKTIWFNGYLDIPALGVWEFKTTTVDGSLLYIGDTVVVANDGQHPIHTSYGKIGLKPGLHRFKLGYFNVNGVQTLKVMVRGPGIPNWQNIPDSWLHRLGNRSPYGKLSVPAANAVIPSGRPVTFSATASDPDGSVAKVSVWINGNYVGSDNAAPYAITASHLSLGFYKAVLVVTDNQGLSYYADAVPFSIADTNLIRLPRTIVTASGTDANSSVTNGYDGNLNTYWAAYQLPKDNQWLQADLRGPCQIVLFRNLFSFAPPSRHFTILGRKDSISAWDNMVREGYNTSSNASNGGTWTGFSQIRFEAYKPNLAEWQAYGWHIGKTYGDVNLALRPWVIAKASGNQTSSNKMRDSLTSTQWQAFPGNGNFVWYDMGNPVDVSSFVFKTANFAEAKNWILSWAGADSVWNDYGRVTLSSDTTHLDVKLPSCRRLRLTSTDNLPSGTAFGIKEWEVYGKASPWWVAGNLPDSGEKPSIMVYPNPCQNVATIAANNLGNGVCQIYSLTGQLKGSFPVQNHSKTQLDLTDYPSGGWMLHIKTSKGSFTSRLLKQ